jgi:hypothetical protein
MLKINNKVQETLPHDLLCTIKNISVARHFLSRLQGENMVQDR